MMYLFSVCIGKVVSRNEEGTHCVIGVALESGDRG